MPVHFLRSSSKKFRAPREYSSSSSKLRQRIFRLSGIDKERKAFEAHYERYRRGRIVQKRDEDLPQEAEEGILYELMCKEMRPAASRSDTRTRTDRKERRQKGFAAQVDVMISAYMDWSCRTKDAGLEGGVSPDPRDALVQDTRTVILIDISRTTMVTYTLLATDKGIAAALVRQGMVPCAPFSPKYAVSIRALELYKNLHCRAPNLAIQTFLRKIHNMQGHQYRKAYRTLFSTAFDVYIEILNDSCIGAGENVVPATSVADSANEARAVGLEN